MPKEKVGWGFAGFSRGLADEVVLKEKAGLVVSAGFAEANENGMLLVDAMSAAFGVVKENMEDFGCSTGFADSAITCEVPFAAEPCSAGFAPNENAGVESADFGARPKLKGAVVGVSVETSDFFDVVPKKSGILDDDETVCFSDADVVDGLSNPKPRFFFDASPKPANSGAIECGAEGVMTPLEGVKRKMPSKATCELRWVAGWESEEEIGGDSGSATIDPAASGEDARGRVETSPFLRARAPPESRDDEGTPKD